MIQGLIMVEGGGADSWEGLKWDRLAQGVGQTRELKYSKGTLLSICFCVKIRSMNMQKMCDATQDAARVKLLLM